MLMLNRARSWYPEYDAVHGFDHIKRVYALCELIGPQENADMGVLRAAALLHDASGSHPGDGQRADHHIRSAAFASSILTEEGWDAASIEAVRHCILTHRFRKNDPPATIEAKVLFDADKLDVIGAIGVVRALAYAFQVKAPAYAEPSDHFLQTGETLPDEAHSAYHEYLYKLQHISSLFFTKTGRRIGRERQSFLNAFFDTLRDENKLNLS